MTPESSIELAGVEKESPEDDKYLLLTDKRERELLYQRTKDLVEFVETHEIDSMVFCDVSARPLNTIFQEVWQHNTDRNKPSISFLNLGSDLYHLIYKHVPKDQSIEDISLDQLEASLGPEVDRVRQEYSQLAQANKILIIDEYTKTGISVRVARRVLELLFPDAQIETYIYSDIGDELFMETGGYPRWRKFASVIEDIDQHALTVGRRTEKSFDQGGPKHTPILDEQNRERYIVSITKDLRRLKESGLPIILNLCVNSPDAGLYEPIAEPLQRLQMTVIDAINLMETGDWREPDGLRALRFKMTAIRALMTKIGNTLYRLKLPALDRVRGQFNLLDNGVFHMLSIDLDDKFEELDYSEIESQYSSPQAVDRQFRKELRQIGRSGE